MMFGWLFFVLLMGLVMLVLGRGWGFFMRSGHGHHFVPWHHGRPHHPHAAGPGLGGREDDPLYWLQMRYARGEISREEYRRMRDDLTAAG